MSDAGWIDAPTGRAYVPPGATLPLDADGLRAAFYAGTLPPDPLVTYLAAHWPERIPREEAEPALTALPASERSGPWDCSWIDGVKLSRTILVF